MQHKLDIKFISKYYGHVILYWTVCDRLRGQATPQQPTTSENRSYSGGN
ncbi:MAG: hypothetical protein V7K55_05560 [Nostoc sp.]